MKKSIIILCLLGISLIASTTNNNENNSDSDEITSQYQDIINKKMKAKKNVFSNDTARFQGLKVYNTVDFLDKILQITPKDEFETKIDYKKRLIKEFAGKEILVSYPVRYSDDKELLLATSIGKLFSSRYDIDNQQIISDITTGGSSFDYSNWKFDYKNRKNKSVYNVTMYLKLDKKIIKNITPIFNNSNAKISFKTPMSVVSAKKLKALKNYGYIAMAKVQVDESLVKSIKIYHLSSRNVLNTTMDVKKIILYNKKLNFIKKF